MFQQRMRLCLCFALLCVFTLGVAGCGGGKEFTKEDFKKVEKGMEEAKVKEILGQPFDTATAVDVTRMWWRVKEDYYSASFKEGKVQAAEGPSKKEEYVMMKGLMEAMKKLKK